MATSCNCSNSRQVRRRTFLPLSPIPTVLPAVLSTVLPGRPYRHSRVSGNPHGIAKDPPFAVPPPPDSRLRGNDGRGRPPPPSAHPELVEGWPPADMENPEESEKSCRPSFNKFRMSGFMDSRLRGNDGRGDGGKDGRRPGRTVERTAGRTVPICYCPRGRHYPRRPKARIIAVLPPWTAGSRHHRFRRWAKARAAAALPPKPTIAKAAASILCRFSSRKA